MSNLLKKKQNILPTILKRKQLRPLKRRDCYQKEKLLLRFVKKLWKPTSQGACLEPERVAVRSERKDDKVEDTESVEFVDNAEAVTEEIISTLNDDKKLKQ